MNIVEIIPVTKNTKLGTLTYFTSIDIPIGSIISIPVRSKQVKGIVISIRKVEDMKSSIKSASYSLKKIDKLSLKKINNGNFLSREFMDTVTEISEYYISNVGTIINTLIPDYILKNINKLKTQKSERVVNNDEIKSSRVVEKYCIQGEDEERYATWKSLIRQEFAKKKSVLFIVPTYIDAEKSFEILEKGIEGYVFILHGSMPIKKIIENWNKIMEEKHPVLIIITPAFLSIYRNDIDTMIIEKENSRNYKIQKRPYLDMRHVSNMLGEKIVNKIYYADSLLRIETLWRHANGEIVEDSPFKNRMLDSIEKILVDMKSNKDKKIPFEKKEFNIFSKEMEEMIKQNKINGEKMLILAIRKGLSPTIVCGDCQTTVFCNKCNSPIVLHSNRSFICHHCGNKRSSEEYCKNCNSWNLVSIGIGIDLIIEKIKEKYPDIEIFKIDSNSIKNEKDLKEILLDFKNNHGSILIGTEMILNYIKEKVENTAIVSMDSLFSIPDFRIQEKILYNIIRLKNLTLKKILIQTRLADEKVFEYGLKGNIVDFYKNTIGSREKFNYPPFSNLIKITIEGKKDIIIKEMEKIQNLLDPYEIEIFPAFTHTIKGDFVLHGLIRINHKKWPDKNLIEKLKSLNMNIFIKVDPETLL